MGCQPVKQAPDWMASGRDCDQAAVNSPLQPPATLMDQAMVRSAQKPHTPHCRGPAVDPVLKVVAVGPKSSVAVH